MSRKDLSSKRASLQTEKSELQQPLAATPKNFPNVVYSDEAQEKEHEPTKLNRNGSTRTVRQTNNFQTKFHEEQKKFY